MRRARFAVVAVALVALGAPAGSSADVLSDYQDLALRRLSPAPLVPTTVPPSLAPLESTLTSSPSRRRSGYALRIVHYTDDGPDAIVVLERDALTTMGATLRDGRRLGFKARRTRVRGHAGYLLTRHLGPTQWSLVWVEDGHIYSLATGTPRKVSLTQLRATATGLDKLGSAYMGTPADPESNSEAFAVTTGRTVTVQVAWEARCLAPDGSQNGIRVGNARATLLAMPANTFTFDVARYQLQTDAWSGGVAGTVAPGTISLSVQASGTFDGQRCDTGPLSFTLTRRTEQVRVRRAVEHRAREPVPDERAGLHDAQ